MDSLTLSLFLIRIILIFTRNIMKEVKKAKSDDNRISVDEMAEIIFEAANKSLDDFGFGEFAELKKILDK